MRHSVLAVLLLVACTAAPEPDSRIGESAPPLESSSPVTNVEWRLVRLSGEPAVEGTPVTLRLVSAEKRAQGNGGCNQYSGPYALAGSSLTFGEIISTKRACVQEALNQQETAFFGVLSRVNRYTVSGSTLRLYRNEHELARFSR